MEKKLTGIAVVAVAMIDARGRVLMQRRPPGSAHAGLWEFPGGKIEAGESRQSAALRELREELGLRLDAADLVPVTTVRSATDAVPAIVIDLYMTRRWTGEPRPCDGAAIAWVEPAALAGLAMPPLDYPMAAVLLTRI